MPHRQAPDRIDEELVCIDSFKHHLKSKGLAKVVDVTPEEDDPPDFWCTIDGERFAVEVTSVVDRSSLEYRARCQQLADAMQAKAEAVGSMEGAYALVLHGKPTLPRRRSQQWRAVLDSAAAFIHRTQNATEDDALPMWADGRARVLLKRCSTSGPIYVGPVGFVVAKWEGESREQVTKLIGERVNKKLARLGGVDKIMSVYPNVALLLYDAYGFCNIDDARAVLQTLPNYKWFHSIYWAASFTDRANELTPDQPGREGAFLWSKNSDWLMLGQDPAASNSPDTKAKKA